MKQRHGCLTAYLVLMIIANSGTALIYLVASETIRGRVPISDWAYLALVIGTLVNLVCAIALFNWKKWGFWGLLVVAAAVFVVNIHIGFVGSALLGLLGVAILYGVLHIGKETTGWSQLD